MGEFKTGANTHHDGCGCWECAGYREADEIADRIADDRVREREALYEEYRRECDQQRIQDLTAESDKFREALWAIYKLTDGEVEPDEGHELAHRVWDVAAVALGEVSAHHVSL